MWGNSASATEKNLLLVSPQTQVHALIEQPDGVIEICVPGFPEPVFHGQAFVASYPNQHFATILEIYPGLRSLLASRTLEVRLPPANHDQVLDYSVLQSCRLGSTLEERYGVFDPASIEIRRRTVSECIFKDLL
jgi:hypothetical protein